MEQQIIDKFKKVGSFDYRLVTKELNKLTSITQKLDYLEKVIEHLNREYNLIDKNLTYDERISKIKNNEVIHNNIYGSHGLTSTLSIPVNVFEEHFKNEIDNPELSFWFLKYNAKQVL